MPIRYAELIESTYTWSFLFVVGSNMILMSVTALQIVVANDPKETIRFVFFVIAQLIHLYVESYIAQMLIDHSASIHDHMWVTLACNERYAD